MSLDRFRSRPSPPIGLAEVERQLHLRFPEAVGRTHVRADAVVTFRGIPFVGQHGYAELALGGGRRRMEYIVGSFRGGGDSTPTAEEIDRWHRRMIERCDPGSLRTRSEKLRARRFVRDAKLLTAGSVATVAGLTLAGHYGAWERLEELGVSRDVSSGVGITAMLASFGGVMWSAHLLGRNLRRAQDLAELDGVADAIDDNRRREQLVALHRADDVLAGDVVGVAAADHATSDALMIALGLRAADRTDIGLLSLGVADMAVISGAAADVRAAAQRAASQRAGAGPT
jgi:hypothetical protein